MHIWAAQVYCHMDSFQQIPSQALHILRRRFKQLDAVLCLTSMVGWIYICEATDRRAWLWDVFSVDFDMWGENQSPVDTKG